LNTAISLEYFFINRITVTFVVADGQHQLIKHVRPH